MMMARSGRRLMRDAAAHAAAAAGAALPSGGPRIAARRRAGGPPIGPHSAPARAPDDDMLLEARLASAAAEARAGALPRPAARASSAVPAGARRAAAALGPRASGWRFSPSASAPLNFMHGAAGGGSGRARAWSAQLICARPRFWFRLVSFGVGEAVATSKRARPSASGLRRCPRGAAQAR
jgi:hypothetical protein